MQDGTEDDAIHPLVNHAQQLLGLPLRVVVGVAHNHRISLGVHKIGDAPDDLGVEQVGHVGNDNAHHVGPGYGDTPGQGVGAVFQLTDGLEHPLPCGITDAGGLVVDNAGHGGLGNIADLRNLGNAVNLFLWFLWQIVISFIKNP